MGVNVLTGDLTFRSLKPCNLKTCSKSDLKAYFENTYDLDESIFVGLKDEAGFYACPDRLRLPLIFYYGHTASVYVNKLILAGLLQPHERVDLAMETLCETGVDEMSWDDTENYRMGGKFEWPALSDVVEYRRQVRKLVLDVIDRTPLSLPITQDSPWWALMMGMEHERIHLETSSVLIRQLPVGMLETPAEWTAAPASHGTGAGSNDLVRVPAQRLSFGKPWNFPSYGWDNEYGKVDCEVAAFEASRYPVTNGEFLQFVLDGGYETPSYWSEEGWRWVKYRQARHPTFWVCGSGCKSGCGGDLVGYSHCGSASRNKQMHCNGHIKVDGNGHHGSDEGGGDNDEYRLRCMYDVVVMPWDWPVEVNYLEAKAFCTWKGAGYRLPCEAEFNLIRGNDHSPDDNDLTSDIIFREKLDANVNFQFGSSTPVNMFPSNARGFHDTSGNVWQWVEDHFNGLPGFRTHAFYDDFSSPTFDGKHNVILGGSWISTGDEASVVARYAFRRHFFQHCGFRLARSCDASDNQTVRLPVRLIEKGVYVLNHGVDNISFALDKARFAVDVVSTTNAQYDYEDEDSMKEMLRLDFSENSLARLIADKMTSLLSKFDVNRESFLHLGCGTGLTTFLVAEHFSQVLGQDFCARFINLCQRLQRDGKLSIDVVDGLKRSRKEISLPDGARGEHIFFKQLTWLSNEIGFFDVIMSTCFDRAMNPEAWLRRLPEVVKDDGLFVDVSNRFSDERDLEAVLQNSFQLLDASDIIYEQYNKKRSVRVSTWRKKSSEM